ncbi:MAG: type II toxin-antitoxin system RelE/ParE family toxin [Acidimicrobiales bacterium]
MAAMSWGEVELEPEVRDWFLALGETDRARVRFHVDRLAELGPLLDEPHTRQLEGKLRELRFFVAGRPTRVTYWIAPGRRIVLLTVFVKTRRQERREVERAKQTMERCMAEAHTADDEE